MKVYYVNKKLGAVLCADVLVNENGETWGLAGLPTGFVAGPYDDLKKLDNALQQEGYQEIGKDEAEKLLAEADAAAEAAVEAVRAEIREKAWAEAKLRFEREAALVQLTLDVAAKLGIEIPAVLLEA